MADVPPMKKRKYDMKTEDGERSCVVESGEAGSNDENEEMEVIDADAFQQQNQSFRTSRNELSAAEVIAILKAAEKGRTDKVILSNAPVKPKAGMIFLYRKKSKNDTRFLNDQYFGFKQNAAKIIQKTLSKKYYQMRLRPEDPSEKKFVKGTDRVAVNFTKTTYALKDSEEKDNAVILIHYLGDEKLYIPQAHGNSKNNRLYTKSSEEIKERIKDQVKDRINGPKKIYEDLVRAGLKANSDRSLEDAVVYEPTDTPRDLEQIKNFKKRHTRENKISKCEIFSVYDMAKTDLKDFILEMDLIPFDAIVFAEPTTLEIANELLKLSKKYPELPQLLSYDTTFELADSYVSMLVMRNVFLHENPVFPVAFIIHDRKVKEVHHTFWDTMKKKLNLSLMDQTVPICPDRESAILSAIKCTVPENTLLSCTNHLKRDATFWLKQNVGNSTDDVAVISQQIALLLESEDFTQFTQAMEAFKQRWSAGFLEYFEQNLEDDVLNSAKFNAQRFAAFENCLPTNNIAKSVNCVIKGYTRRMELPVDALVLKLIELQCANLSEFFRAHRKIGRYRMKQEFQHLFKWKQPVYVHFTESDFTAAVKASSTPDDLLFPDLRISKELRAKKCIEMKLIGHFADQQMFVVISPYSMNTYNVTRNPNQRKNKREFLCNCKSPSLCYHIMAVQMSIGDLIYEESIIHKLSVVKKKNRGGKGRLGRKKPNLQDLLANVSEAKDSLLAKQKQELGCVSSDDEPDDFRDVKERNGNFVKERIVNFNVEEKDGSIDFKEDNEMYDAYGDDVFHRDDSKLPVVKKSHKLEDRSSPKLFEQNDSQENDFEKMFVTDLQAEHSTDIRRFSNYPTLASGWIEGSIIDGVVGTLLQQHDACNVMYVDEVIYRSVIKDSTAIQVAQYSHHRGGLNKDLVLVTVGNGNHWMLGTITLSSKTVCLFDSLYHPSRKDAQVDSFQNLLKIAHAIHRTDNLHFNYDDWDLFYASDSPEQLDGTECGVIVCLMTYAFLKKLHFPSHDTLHGSNHLRNRKWMLNVLENGPQSKGSDENRRFPSDIKKTLAEPMPEVSLPPSRIQIGRCRALVADCFHDDGSWSVCRASGCPGDTEHIDKQILCVACRSWFHLSCLNVVYANLTAYFKCSSCLN